MKKYKVTFEERERFEVIVEAETREEVEAKAEEKFNSADYKEDGCLTVECVGIEEIK